jgi:selenocysteine-specific elongation factor
LVKERRLVRVAEFVFHPEALDRLKMDVKAMRTASTTAVALDVSGFKARYGLSRKFAIPLLEWLDRERVTRRVGEKRQVL